MTQEFILRIFIAAMLGSVIGLEREYRAKEAGFRTHFLVALGSALFMILSIYGVEGILGQMPHVSFDPSRIASQVVTGIGFIGAGTIIFQKHVVRGLTTAAGLWVTAAIGLTIGAGMYLLGVAATVLVLLCLEALNFILRRIGTRNISVTFSTTDKQQITRILHHIRDHGIEIETYQMQSHHSAGGEIFTVNMDAKVKRKNYQNNVLDFMSEFEGVTLEGIE